MKWTHCVYVFGICAVIATGSVANAQIINDENACTWGISNDELSIPSGSIITQAVLVLNNVRSTRSDAGLYVQLLDNPDADIDELTDAQPGNYFGVHGALLKEVSSYELSATPQTITIDLNQVDDPQSWTRNIFKTAPVITLADSTTVTCSSSMLSLFDYAGTGRSFGFGIDCDGVAIDAISLHLTIESRTELISPKTLTFTAGAVSNAPVLQFIADQTGTEGKTLSFTVNAEDADGDSLTYSAAALPNGATFTNGTFIWTPGYDQAGTYQMTVTVSDGVESDSQLVTIAILDQNRAPVLNSIGSKTVSEGQTLSFTASATDPDGDALALIAYSLPTGAAFKAGVFSWTPGYDQNGTYQVTIAASDGILSDSETITLTVNNTNRAPVLNSIGSKTVSEGQTLSFTTSATDPDGDAFALIAYSLPTGAVFKAGIFSWTPGYDQSGTYQVTIAASDGILSDSETITLTVNNTNRAPVLAQIAPQTINALETLTFTVSCSDADGDSVNLSAQNLPVNAAFAKGTFTFTPTNQQAGTYQVTIVANDGNGGTDTITVQITVKEVIVDWAQVVYEDFEGSMGLFTDGGKDCKLYASSRYAHHGNYSVNIQDNSSTNSSFYLTNGIDISAKSEMKIEFWYMPVSMDNSSEDFRLEYWNGSQWITCKKWAYGVDFKNGAFYSESITLKNTDYTFHKGAKIRFVCDASSNYDDVYIDEVSISVK